MNVSRYVPPATLYVQETETLDSMSQMYPHILTPTRFVNMTLPGNRLIEHPDGSLELISKSPAEVIGEHVLRPLIDGVYSFSGCLFETLRGGVSSFHHFFSRTFNLLPVAEAASEHVMVYTPAEASKPDLSTPDKALEYLRKKGYHSPLPSSTCLAHNQLLKIKRSKEHAMQGLGKAYNDLQTMTQANVLASCHREILELLQEMSSRYPEYPIQVLNPLPDWLISLLKYSTDYTPKDLKILITTVDQLTKKMVSDPAIRKESKAFSSWIELLSISMERSRHDTEALAASISLMNQFLEDGLLQERQKRLIRKWAKWFLSREVNSSEQGRIDANNILTITGPQTYVGDWIHSYLERVTHDIKLLEPFDGYSTLQELTTLSLAIALRFPRPIDWKRQILLINLIAIQILSLLCKTYNR